jgi:hypothetical protein
MVQQLQQGGLQAQQKVCAHLPTTNAQKSDSAGNYQATLLYDERQATSAVELADNAKHDVLGLCCRTEHMLRCC